MTALSEWHFGKGRGRTYCEGCEAAGAACATTTPKDCVYHREAPRSDAGRMAWQLFLDNSWRVQIVGMGVVAGVDTSRAEARLEAVGLHREIADDLLSACELGFVTAANEKDEADGTKG